MREVRGRDYPADMIFLVQKKAWMDEDLMLEWIDHVWQPFANLRP